MYEWNHGFVEKRTAMNQEQTTIFLLLSRVPVLPDFELSAKELLVE